MKIVFNNETKKLPNLTNFKELVQKVTTAFENQSISENQKFFYNDEDGDTITVSTQADLDEAIKSMPSKLKLFVNNDVREASDAMSQSMLDRSIIMTGRASLNLNEDPFFIERQHSIIPPIKFEYPSIDSLAKPQPVPVPQPVDTEEMKKKFQEQMNQVIQNEVAKYC
jgi:hypothetical protein